jgi:16S rRNA C967 or C1407 C5-methylase (RsmB/RsmF family)/NOL1/NOP2/fmu family ribosome biogenesis protein
MSRKLPIPLLDSLSGLPGFDRVAFENVHTSGEQLTSIRLNPAKLLLANSQLPIANPVSWCDQGYYLTSRPSFTFDPLFHAGCYYVQEASSMFLEEAVRQTVDLSRPLRVLDLCAAPGGKSTHLQSLIPKEGLLVSNEVIRSRVNVLKDNIIKWGTENVVVTNNDATGFTALENYFDLVVIDAPCSGSGLFRRDPEAIDEWSENNVQLCSQRQQRIIADIWPALKKGGVLIYSTCSYSKEEDEDIMDWLVGTLAATNKELAIPADTGIVEALSPGGNKGYRFWPDKIKGEGFFLSVFQKTDGEEEAGARSRKKIMELGKKEMPVIANWVQTEGRVFVRHENTVYAWPAGLVDDFNLVLEKLRVIYSGLLAGELVRDKLIPGHALAMSCIVADGIGRVELTREQAIRYLQRKELVIEASNKGWQLVTWFDQPLGWVNILPNRINNYYPKELRILKDS